MENIQQIQKFLHRLEKTHIATNLSIDSEKSGKDISVSFTLKQRKRIHFRTARAFNANKQEVLYSISGKLIAVNRHDISNALDGLSKKDTNIYIKLLWRLLTNAVNTGKKGGYVELFC